MNKKLGQMIGKWWFKYRSYSPLPLLILAVFYPYYNVADFRIYMSTGLFLILAGEAGRLWCVGYAGGITRTRTGDLDRLVTSGPFSYVRNPIYISNIIMYTGVTLLLGVPALIPFALLYFFIQYN
ncbi:MAG: hypothetical protein JXA66_02235, partial [Oligoflexia bacterium]|nr:hypothetical protein [Oligoflexia bacterium]